MHLVSSESERSISTHFHLHVKRSLKIMAGQAERVETQLFKLLPLDCTRLHKIAPCVHFTQF